MRNEERAGSVFPPLLEWSNEGCTERLEDLGDKYNTVEAREGDEAADSIERSNIMPAGVLRASDRFNER